MSRRRVVVGGRRGVGVGFVASLSLDLGLNLSKVLLQLPEIVVRQHDRMPAVRLWSGHGPLWAVGFDCQSDGRRSDCTKNMHDRISPASIGMKKYQALVMVRRTSATWATVLLTRCV